jgi:hypothetical protein
MDAAIPLMHQLTACCRRKHSVKLQRLARLGWRFECSKPFMHPPDGLLVGVLG